MTIPLILRLPSFTAAACLSTALFMTSCKPAQKQADPQPAREPEKAPAEASPEPQSVSTAAPPPQAAPQPQAAPSQAAQTSLQPAPTTLRHVFPAGAAAIVNITQPPYNADPTGEEDSTAAIQKAIDLASFDGVAGDGVADDGTDDGIMDGSSRRRPRIVYFPNGIYRITDTLRGTANTGRKGGGLVVLQGESRDGAILRLDARAPGFDDPAAPKPLFSNFNGDYTNNAFMNGIESLTFEVGAGNPGAIAVAFANNNCGYVRNVVIRSLDPAGAGAAGLNLCPGSEPTNPTGIGLIEDVFIEGFAIGVDISRGFHMPWVFEGLRLRGQTAAGILNGNRPLCIRDLQSQNAVPAILSTGDAALVVLLDSRLTGGSPDHPAVNLMGGWVFMRNVAHSGYRTALQVSESDVDRDLANSEYTNGPVLKLWDDTPPLSLNLPIERAPEIPWDAPADWALAAPPTGDADKDTAALQEALSSGKPSVMLQPGNYRVNATIEIGPGVRRIHGGWSSLRFAEPFKMQNRPLLRLGASDRPAVVIEKLQSDWSDATSYFLHHESNADLILRDIFWVAGPVYRNTPGAGGRLFIENVHSLGGKQEPRENCPAFVFERQQVWARQINPEMQHPHIINKGGQVWILGFKTGEQRGPVVVTRDGGFTEILGGIQNQTYDFDPPRPDDTAIIEVTDGHVSASLVERFEGVGNRGPLGWGNNAIVAKETRNGETRVLRPRAVHRSTGVTEFESPVPVRPGQLGSVIPLFVGYREEARGGSQAPAP